MVQRAIGVLCTDMGYRILPPKQDSGWFFNSLFSCTFFGSKRRLNHSHIELCVNASKSVEPNYSKVFIIRPGRHRLLEFEKQVVKTRMFNREQVHK